MRKYALTAGVAVASERSDHAFCIMCPNRFKQNGMIYRWIGRELLGTESVANLGEIGFLERVSASGASDDDGDEVGRIDNILVVPQSEPLRWCAVETQAVYFSGPGMGSDFDAIVAGGGTEYIPQHLRRPDFRSSAPKRLMPQLQIKVPTLSRWGKKTAIVIDEAFFNSLGPMRFERDMSNADIAWFVVAARNSQEGAQLADRFVRYTTLSSAVEGLTAGRAVSQEVFESRIRNRLEARNFT